MTDFSDMSIEERTSYVQKVKNELSNRLEKTSRILYVASLLDTEGCSHVDSKTCLDLMNKLQANNIGEKEVKDIVDFANNLKAKPRNWDTCHLQNTTMMSTKLKSMATSSFEKLKPKRSTSSSENSIDSIENLSEIAESIKRIVGTATFPAVERNTTGWNGGKLSQYIVEFGDTLLKECIYTYYTKDAEGKPEENHVKENRLTNLAIDILRTIVKDVGDKHLCLMAYGENLTIDKISLTKHFDVEMPPCSGKQHSKDSCEEDCNNLRTIIVALLKGTMEGTMELPSNCPKDLNHLYELLLNPAEGCEEYHNAIFSHACLWTPSNIIMNISIFDKLISSRLDQERKESYRKLEEKKAAARNEGSGKSRQTAKEETMMDKVLKEMNQTISDGWYLKDIKSKDDPYYHVFCWWWDDKDRWAKGRYNFMTAVDKEKGFYVLEYMRLCFPHINSHRAKVYGLPSISLPDIEEELYVMFPTYMSKLFLALSRNKFNFQKHDVC